MLRAEVDCQLLDGADRPLRRADRCGSASGRRSGRGQTPPPPPAITGSLSGRTPAAWR
jgi:hypothetical protein